MDHRAPRVMRATAATTAAAIALALTGAAPALAAPPPPLLIARADVEWSDASGTAITGFRVLELPAAPAPGTYLAVGLAGPVGVVALDADPPQPHRGACPYLATFTLAGGAVRLPAADEQVVIVGPIDPRGDGAADALAHAHLLRLGLARAGRPADEAAEPLGAAPPPGDAPAYAVDLDGDGVADVALARATATGRYVRGVAKVRSSLRVWLRRAGRWKAGATCRWTDTDVID